MIAGIGVLVYLAIGIAAAMTVDDIDPTLESLIVLIGLFWPLAVLACGMRKVLRPIFLWVFQ